jgi:hypothetical protein
VQQRARRHGDAGIHGNSGIVESVSCRIYEMLSGSNPTLSANSFAFGSVVGGSGRLQASRGSLTLAPLGTNPTLSAAGLAGGDHPDDAANVRLNPSAYSIGSL